MICTYGFYTFWIALIVAHLIHIAAAENATKNVTENATQKAIEDTTENMVDYTG